MDLGFSTDIHVPHRMNCHNFGEPIFNFNSSSTWFMAKSLHSNGIPISISYALYLLLVNRC